MYRIAVKVVKKNYFVLGVLATLAGGYLAVGILFSIAHTWPMLIVSVPILVLGLFLIRKGTARQNPADKSE